MVPENAHYQQHGCGYFPFKSLLRCSDDSSLPLVEKIRNSMGFWATNRLRVDKVWTAGCFSVQPLLRIISNNRLHRIKISSCFPCWMGCKTLFCSYSCAHFPWYYGKNLDNSTIKTNFLAWNDHELLSTIIIVSPRHDTSWLLITWITVNF